MRRYYIYPSKEISDLIGFKIHEEWELPNDRDYLNEYCCHKKSPDSYFEELWLKFIKIHPYITKWLIKNDIEIKKHIISGMVSMFNEDDIIEFIGKNGFGSERTTAYYILLKKAKKINGIEEFGYIPSTKTLNKIINFKTGDLTPKIKQ